MPYIATRWELDTKKSEKKIGYAIIELPKEFLDLIDANNFVFNEIPQKFLMQKVAKYTRKGNIKNREYKRYKRNSVGQKIYVQRQDVKKQPFISVRFPLVWRKKHIQTFFSLFSYKYWCKITWKAGREVVPANHENVFPIKPESIPNDVVPAKIILW